MRLSDYQKFRLLEMIPGLLVWFTFLAMIAISFIKPLWAIFFIIVFDVYWLIKIIYLLIYLLLSYRNFSRDRRCDWLKILRQNHPDWRKIIHVIFLPASKETADIILPTFQGLANCAYPNERMVIVFACEEKFRPHLEPVVFEVQKRFGSTFLKLFISWHPSSIPGEIPGKGSNCSHAAKTVQKDIDRLGIPYENIIVSNFDIDTVVHPQYFAYLTVKYLNHPNPTKASYQPVPLFHNNIWDAPMIMRVASFGTTFWLMTEQLRPERLFTFSSHSMSYRALHDVGFWQNDIVTEDSRIFLQCFFHYNGEYEVVPLFIPVSMDAVVGETWWKSLKNLYRQQRRWMYGVEHVPYMMWFFTKSKIPLRKQFQYLWNQGEGVYSMATAPLIIFVLGRLPLWVTSWNPSLEEQMIVQQAPFILERLMVISMIGLAVCCILSLILLPPKPHRRPLWSYALMVVQWILLPISMIIFGSFPAIEAQTRLMTGKYLGFHITPKSRSTTGSARF